MLGIVNAADGACVHAAPLLFELGHELNRADLGRATHGASGEDGAQRIQLRSIGPKLSGDARRQMDDVAELFDVHERLDARRRWIAHAIDVIACEIDEHDMLSTVFRRLQERLA